MTVAAAAQTRAVAARFSPGWISQVLQRYVLHIVVIGLTVGWMLPTIGLGVLYVAAAALLHHSWWMAAGPQT